MSSNSKKFVRKYSLKIYRSRRLLHYPIPDDPESIKMKKEVPTQKKYNINIIKPEKNQNQGNIKTNTQEQKKIYSSTTTATNNRNLSAEEKKVVIKKTPISAKNSIKANNKEEIIIKPLNRNNSGTKIISNVKESQIQNKYINTNTNNQPLFYSNIDLNGYNKNNNKDINIKNINESAYIDKRRINNEIENKNQYRENSQTMPQITKVVPPINNQIKKVTQPQQKNLKINLQQSKSQTSFKISSNNPTIKIRTNPVQKNINDRSIPQPQPTLRKNITNINVKSSKIQINSTSRARQNTAYISSNTSRRNSNAYQNKDINKTFNTSSIKQNNYIQKTQKINIPNAQNKNYRTENKPSIQLQQINSGKNSRNNNQNYYSSQIVNRQEKSNYNILNTNVYISDNRNKKDYNIKTKDYKTQTNYDRNKNHNAYEVKNVNKENYDKNKGGYSYVVNFNNDIKSSATGNKPIDANKNQRRNAFNS